MNLLDTSVMHELMRPEPDGSVIAWLDTQPAQSVWTTSITVFEIRMGLELLERGRRRQLLQEAFDQVLEDDLEGRIQPLDRAAALAAATIAADRQRAGHPVDLRDVQVAGIAAACRATLASRNVRRFRGIGLKLTNPWATR